MSDKAEKPAEAAADKPAEKAEGGKKGGFLTKLPVLLGGVMIIEAGVLFAGFKFLGGGASHASGAELTTEEEGDHADAGHGEAKEEGHGEAKKDDSGHGGSSDHGAAADHGSAPAKPKGKRKSVELKVVEFRAQNKLSGKTFIYDVSIYVVAKAEFEEKVKQTIEDRGALIQDRIRTIIAQNDPEKLGGGSEPGLETLRRQVKYQLDEIIGDSMVQEVLVPKCIPFAGGY